MTKRRKNWWGRNWKWFVPVLCLTAFLLLATFAGLLFAGYTLMTKAMRTSAAYQTAVQAARADPQVLAALGSPIKEGRFLTGNFSVTQNWPGGKTENVRFNIPIYGPKGKGTILVVATKTAGTWTFSKETVHIEATGAEIDLNTKPAGN